MNNLFYNCKNLEYINLLNFTDNKNPTKQEMFTGIAENAVICIDQNKAPLLYDIIDGMPCVSISCRPDWKNVQYRLSELGDCIINCTSTYSRYESSGKCYDICEPNCKTCNTEEDFPSDICTSCYENKYLEDGKCVDRCENGYSYYNSSDNIYYCTLDYSCPKDFNKLISMKKECIDDCSKDFDYPYEFKNQCYQECPQNISVKSVLRTNYCEIKCSLEFPFEIIGTQECVNNCSINEREKGICKINYISQDENNKESEEKAVENIKEQLTKDFNTSDVDYGKDIVIKQQFPNITITTTENQKKEKSSNSTTIDLGECENKIKDEYNISKNKSLYILKIEVKQKGLKIPKIVYEVYYPLLGDNLIKLNLTVCKNSKIVISIPVALTEDIDIINPKSDFYNDICYTYTSEDGTDISLLDRKKNFVDNNLTICEEDCDFNEYNYTTGKVTCSCDANINPTTKIGDISFDKNKLFNSFINFKNIMNIDVLKCYKLIFKLDSFMHNYANLTMLIIFILFVITLFIFYFRDCYNLEKILTLIVYFKLNLNLAKKFLKKKIKLNNINNLIVIKIKRKK